MLALSGLGERGTTPNGRLQPARETWSELRNRPAKRSWKSFRLPSPPPPRSRRGGGFFCPCTRQLRRPSASVSEQAKSRPQRRRGTEKRGTKQFPFSSPLLHFISPIPSAFPYLLLCVSSRLCVLARTLRNRGVAKNRLDFGPAGLGYWLLKSRSTALVNSRSKRSSAEEGAR